MTGFYPDITDALLRVRRTCKPASVSTRLERRIEQIERTPAKPKQQLLGIIDTFIAAHQQPPATALQTTRPAALRALCVMGDQEVNLEPLLVPRKLHPIQPTMRSKQIVELRLTSHHIQRAITVIIDRVNIGTVLN